MASATCGATSTQQPWSSFRIAGARLALLSMTRQRHNSCTNAHRDSYCHVSTVLADPQQANRAPSHYPSTPPVSAQMLPGWPPATHRSRSSSMPHLAGKLKGESRHAPVLPAAYQTPFCQTTHLTCPRVPCAAPRPSHASRQLKLPQNFH